MKNEITRSLLESLVSSELKAIINEGYEQQFSYLIEAAHGVGKSAFVKDMCLKHDGFLIDLRLGQRDLGDILGFPQVVELDNGQKIFTHIKPELIRKAFVTNISELGYIGDPDDVLASKRDKKKLGQPYQFIMFFADEYNRGSKDVQQSMFELVYDRRMSGVKVHPRTLIFAACNDNLEVYTITEGDPAFRSRFQTYKYTPTVQEWIDWGRQTGELCEALIMLVTREPQYADPPKSDKGDLLDILNQPHTNRRSWHEFSKWFIRFGNQFTLAQVKNICAGYVGEIASNMFEQFQSKLSTLKTQEKKSAAADSAGVAKVQEFINMYIQTHKWDYATAEGVYKTFTVAEEQVFADQLIDVLDRYRFILGETQSRVKRVATMMPKEVFTKVWKTCKNDIIKSSLKQSAASEGDPDFYKMFEE